MTRSTPWPRKPFIYEINTRVWLTELSRKYDRPVTLATLPDEAVEALADLHIDAVWMMGVWTRSKAVRESALNYRHEYRPVLPDLTDADVIGSAYAIGGYQVDPAAGGRDGLAAFRKQLRKHKIKLVLDYVPNHVAVDHPWVAQHPTHFVRSDARDHRKHPGMFFPTKDAWGRELYIAHGRDPYFPGWIDTAQLNAFNPGARKATIDTLLDIASQCDGVRCDMAMLMKNDVFRQTWGWMVEDPMPQQDFWDEVIPAVRAKNHDFLFIAEVYWGMEYQLQQQGFDYTYDKELYDRFFSDDNWRVREHLGAALDFQRHTIRFIENHDEGRAASSFGVQKSKALAALIATLPGAVLLHDGQFSGRRVKLPVQIQRQPEETEVPGLRDFYDELLKETRAALYQDGDWRLFDVHDGQYLAYGWRKDNQYRLIVINASGREAHGTVSFSGWGAPWRLHDALNRATEPATSQDGKLYLGLRPYEVRIFHLEKVEAEQPVRKETKKA